MNFKHITTDFILSNRTANMWFDVDGEPYAVSFKGWGCEQSGDVGCEVKILDSDAYPIKDDEGSYVEISSTLRERAHSMLATELTDGQRELINADFIDS